MTASGGTLLTYADFPASPGQRRTALAVAALITLIALATMPFARMPGPVIAPFMPSAATAVILLDLITALLFFLQFHQHGRPSTLILSCAYLYTALIVVPYILVFPGVFSVDGLLGAGSQSSAWLWLFWHGGFPALLLAHAAILRRELQGGTSKKWPAGRSLSATLATLLLVIALASLAILGHDWLPEIIRKNHYHPPTIPGIGVIVCLLNLGALFALWHITRGRTVTQLWLTIAMLAFLLDTAISLGAGARFSVGWYLARANSLLCASAVLGAFVCEFHQLQNRLASANQQLAELADTDMLTDLGNRRSFDRQLAQEWARAARDNEPLGLLLLDIDHFKDYNDCYGHQAGDSCLQRVAAAIRNVLHRPADFAARYGGEEIAIILPKTGSDNALHVAQSMLNAICELGIEHRKTRGGILTCSIGIAVKNGDSHQDPVTLFADADAALYRAKNAGRNRVHR